MVEVAGVRGRSRHRDIGFWPPADGTKARRLLSGGAAERASSTVKTSRVNIIFKMMKTDGFLEPEIHIQ